MTSLIASVAIVAVHILLGMAVNAYILIRDGHPLDALFDVGSWWLLFAGIALGVLGYGWYVAIAGCAALILFIIGHLFNMGINIIGTFVHAARLQYLEFFGKFYKEGGKPFRPFAYKTQYTDIIKEEN